MNNLLEAIKNAIEDITGKNCRLTSTGELECVCPKCLGSKTRKNKRQFYVSINEPGHPFICFRCGFKGSLKVLLNFLNEVGRFPVIVKSSADKEEKIAEKRETGNMELFYAVNKFRRIQYEEFKKSKQLESVYCPNCRHYVLNRIFGDYYYDSENFDEDFLSNIATNILCCRFVKTITKGKYKDFIGLSSFSGSVLQLRTLRNNSNIRYITLKTTEVLPESYFTINLGDKNGRRTLLLAEGVFTLLRGYLYLKNIGYIKSNSITLVATFGKNNFLKELNNVKLLKNYDDIVALLDSDVEVYKNVRSKVKLLKPIDKKDFGEVDAYSTTKEFVEVKHEHERLHYRAYGRKL